MIIRLKKLYLRTWKLDKGFQIVIGRGNWELINWCNKYGLFTLFGKHR